MRNIEILMAGSCSVADTVGDMSLSSSVVVVVLLGGSGLDLKNKNGPA